MGNALTDWTGIESLHTDILPGHGWGGTGTVWQDTAEDLFGWEGSGMREDAEGTADKYGGWYYDDASKTEKNPFGTEYFHNLKDWDVYQSWKAGSGPDFRAIDKKVREQTDKDIDKWLKNEGRMEQLNKDFRKHTWSDLSDADKKKYDYNASYMNYYNERLRREKEWYNNYNEFSQTGQDYANWASNK